MSVKQAEIGYQIACAYGLDIHEQARKGEILAIFGLALGGSQALKTGFKYLARNVPIAGAAVGASTNAVALYAVGHAACQFYEAKLNSTQSNAVVEQSEEKSEQYFKEAIAQQILMDQILAHVVKAGNPEKSWQDILPQLQSLNFSLASLEIIARNSTSPEPLEFLLSKINQEFAVPLLGQCQKIAESDGTVTSEEAAVIELITNKLSTAEEGKNLSEAADKAATNIRNGLFKFRKKR